MPPSRMETDALGSRQIPGDSLWGIHTLRALENFPLSLAGPRRYIFEVTETLRELTGLGLARADNLVEAPQNADVFLSSSPRTN